MGTLDGTKDEDMKFDPFGNIEDEDEEQQAENSQENGMDSELKEDSSFADQIDKMVRYSEMDQGFKGEDIN